jgi:hypothetical protein
MKHEILWLSIPGYNPKDRPAQQIEVFPDDSYQSVLEPGKRAVYPGLVLGYQQET